jgi:hypothetical protein
MRNGWERHSTKREQHVDKETDKHVLGNEQQCFWNKRSMPKSEIGVGERLAEEMEDLSWSRRLPCCGMQHRGSGR